MLWLYFPGLTMFEFINQYHFFLSEQPFSASLTNCKIELQSLLFALVLKRDPKLHMNHLLEYTSYVLQLWLYFIHASVLALKIQSPVREIDLHSGEF